MPDPAFVADQLLAFHEEPVRYRSRLTHGREPFPGGLHVFRFAQGKFPEAMRRKLSQAERERVRAAAAFFVRQVCGWDGASHYQVLCVAPDSRTALIREHYQGLMALVHPDRALEEDARWPDEFVQRANQAWAVLADESARRGYDASLEAAGRSPAPTAGLDPEAAFPAPRAAPGRRNRSVRGARLRTTMAGTAVALAGLMFAFTWWASQVPSEFETLREATPFELTLRWMRESVSHARPPGFLAVTEALASREARRLEDTTLGQASPTAREPKPAAGAEAGSMPPAEPRYVATHVAQDTSAPPPVEPAKASRAARTPQPALVAQRTEPVPTVAGLAPLLPDLEVLVSRVVSYYEAGDLDRFVSLFDAESVGVVEAYRIRNRFDDYFGATSARRLRIQAVDWTQAEGRLRAKGRAIVVAEYRDPATRRESDVSLEMDVVMRAGSPRISRLSLFPHE